jgi:hypothetical protein
MTDNTELQRLIRLRYLTRQITARLSADVDCEQAFQMLGYVGELKTKKRSSNSGRPPKSIQKRLDIGLHARPFGNDVSGFHSRDQRSGEKPVAGQLTHRLFRHTAEQKESLSW